MFKLSLCKLKGTSGICRLTSFSKQGQHWPQTRTMWPDTVQVGLENLWEQLVCIPVPCGEKSSMMWSQNLSRLSLTISSCPPTVLTAAVCVGPLETLSYLNQQWLNNVLSFPGDNLERNSDVHEFGWKLLLMMRLSWLLLNRPRSRLGVPCCREEDCLFLTRNCLLGRGGVNLENKTSVIMPAFLFG